VIESVRALDTARLRHVLPVTFQLSWRDDAVLVLVRALGEADGAAVGVAVCGVGLLGDRHGVGASRLAVGARRYGAPVVEGAAHLNLASCGDGHAGHIEVELNVDAGVLAPIAAAVRDPARDEGFLALGGELDVLGRGQAEEVEHALAIVGEDREDCGALLAAVRREAIRALPAGLVGAADAVHLQARHSGLVAFHGPLAQPLPNESVKALVANKRVDTSSNWPAQLPHWT
jgi:hypothetical protein